MRALLLAAFLAILPKPITSLTVRGRDGGYRTVTPAEADAGLELGAVVLDTRDALACACSTGLSTCLVPNPDAGNPLPAPVGVTLQQWSGTCRPKPCTVLYLSAPDGGSGGDETWPDLLSCPVPIQSLPPVQAP